MLAHYMGAKTVILFLFLCLLPIKAVIAGYGVPATDAYWVNTAGVLTTTTSGDKMVIGTTTAGATEVLVIGTVTGSSIICNANDNSFITVGSNTIGTSSININSSGTLAKFMNPNISTGSSIIAWYLGKDVSLNSGTVKYGHNNATEKGVYFGNNEAVSFNGVNGGVGINKTPSAPDTLDTRFRVRITDKGTGTTAMRVQLDDANITGGGFIQFTSFNDVVGSIDVVDFFGDDFVQYNNFAGAHSTIVENTAVRRYTILESTGETLDGYYDQLVKTRVSSKRKSKRVYGVYVGKIGKQDGDGYDLCQSLGAGYIWVVNTGDNIKVNDYLMSSDVAGYAEKQDDNIMRNYSIAKSSENVIWKDSERKKLIACTIHGG